MSNNTKSAILIAGIVLAALFVVAGFFVFSTSYVREVDLTSTTSVTATGAADDNRPVIRVAIAAMISPGVTKQYYEGLLKMIGDKVGRRTILVQRKTYGEINTLIERRDIDLAFVCAGPYVQGHDRFGLEIAAVPVVGGETVYYSYIIANAQSHIRTFDDLRGKRFAFTDPDSNTGYLVPGYMLEKQNETPKKFFSDTFFTYSHDNSIKAVSEGLADGAAVDSLIWDFLRTTTPASVEKTVVIHKSTPYGIPPLVVHPEMNSDLKAQLKSALLTLHKDAKARELLYQVRIDRFVEGNDAMYETVREMRDWQGNAR